jgi:hypothetical protein
MSATLVGFTIFALSNIIYVGPVKLVDVPLPGRVVQTVSMFRSTGRFFWPVMYSITALAIVAPIALYGRYGSLLLCLAVPLQWIDSRPLRQLLEMSTHAPEKPHIDLETWRSVMTHHNSIQVLPQYFCLLRPTGWNAEVAVELQLLAAFADRPINTISAARLGANCNKEQHIDGTLHPGARQLSVFLDEFSGFSRMQVLAATSKECRASYGLVVCSDIPEEGPNLAALVRTDRR